MFPHIMRILRSPNVKSTLDNFTRDVKSSLVTEAHSLEAVIVIIYLTNNVFAAPWKVMFLYFQK
jgi:hypothetical protein